MDGKTFVYYVNLYRTAQLFRVGGITQHSKMGKYALGRVLPQIGQSAVSCVKDLFLLAEDLDAGALCWRVIP